MHQGDIGLSRTFVAICNRFVFRCLVLFCKYWQGRARIYCCTGLLVSRTISRINSLLGSRILSSRKRLLLGECCQPPRARRASQEHAEETLRMWNWWGGSSPPVGEFIWPGKRGGKRGKRKEGVKREEAREVGG